MLVFRNELSVEAEYAAAERVQQEVEDATEQGCKAGVLHTV